MRWACYVSVVKQKVYVWTVVHIIYLLQLNLCTLSIFYEIAHQLKTTNSQVYVQMARIYFNKQVELVTDTRNKSFDGTFVELRKVVVHRQSHLCYFISSKRILRITMWVEAEKLFVFLNVDLSMKITYQTIFIQIS